MEEECNSVEQHGGTAEQCGTVWWDNGTVWNSKTLWWNSVVEERSSVDSVVEH